MNTFLILVQISILFKEPLCLFFNEFYWSSESLLHGSTKEQDDHYCNALFKYAREIAIKFNEYSTFVNTNNKNKIKVEVQGCPTSAVKNREGGFAD